MIIGPEPIILYQFLAYIHLYSITSQILFLFISGILYNNISINFL